MPAELLKLVERQRRLLRAIRAVTVHHGWATTHLIGPLAGVVTEADALQLVQDLLTLHEHGLVQREVPPTTGPTLWALTSAGRKAVEPEEPESKGVA